MSQAQAQREDRWRKICREIRDSGMTRKAFCESRGIALSTLGYWLKRLSALASSPQSSAFVPMGTVEFSPRAVLRIRLGGEVVAELDLPADEMVIRDVMKAAVYVRPGVTDMRKAINGLSIIVTEQMESDPLCGALYIFCNHERRILKGLWWDRNGFWLLQNRLERDRFPWPASEEAAREITTEQLQMLLDGIDFWRADRARIYESVS